MFETSISQEARKMMKGNLTIGVQWPIFPLKDLFHGMFSSVVMPIIVEFNKWLKITCNLLRLVLGVSAIFSLRYVSILNLNQ